MTNMTKPCRVLSLIRSLHFQKKLRICFTAMALLLLLFFALTFWSVSSNTISEMGTRLSEDNAQNACAQIGKYFDLIRQNSVQFIRMNSLRHVLKATSSDNISEPDAAALALDIRDIVDYSSSVVGIDYTMINIYCDNGYSYTTDASVQLPFSNFDECLSWYTDTGYLEDSLSSDTWCHLIDTPTISGRHQYSFVYLRPLFSSSTYQLVGILLATVSEPSIRSTYSEYYPDAYIIHRSGVVVSAADIALLNESIMDKPGTQDILSSTSNAGTVTYFDDGTQYMLSYQAIAYGDAYAIVPFQHYHGLDKTEIHRITLAAVLIAVVALGMAALLSYWLSYSLSRSVCAVTDVVRQVEQGDRQARCLSKQSDEIGYIGSRINAMLDQMELDNQQQQAWEHVQQGLKLQLLQSQFNPHLLYNCLNSALWALQQEDRPCAQDILMGMSRFFKCSLSSTGDIIRLQEELALMQSYINLQCSARGKNFTLVNLIPEELLDILVPKFTLQPMIENSVIHGFTNFRDDGCITLRGNLEGSHMHLLVQDNGIGLEPDCLSALNDKLQGCEMPPDGSAFGICNVNLRLHNYFGGDTGIALESEVGEYTCVHVTLHLHNEEREQPCMEL